MTHVATEADINLCTLEVLLALAERLTGCSVEATVTIAPGETVQVTASGRVRFSEHLKTPRAPVNQIAAQPGFAPMRQSLSDPHHETP